jgi:hypothetical protein
MHCVRQNALWNGHANNNNKNTAKQNNNTPTQHNTTQHTIMVTDIPAKYLIVVVIVVVAMVAVVVVAVVVLVVATTSPIWLRGIQYPVYHLARGRPRPKGWQQCRCKHVIACEGSSHWLHRLDLVTLSFCGH